MSPTEPAQWVIATLALGTFLVVISGVALGIMKGSIMVTALWVVAGMAFGAAIGWVAGVRTERYRARRRRQRRIAQIGEAGAKLFRAMTAPEVPPPHPTKIIMAEEVVAAGDTTAE